MEICQLLPSSLAEDREFHHGRAASGAYQISEWLVHRTHVLFLAKTAPQGVVQGRYEAKSKIAQAFLMQVSQRLPEHAAAF